MRKILALSLLIPSLAFAGRDAAGNYALPLPDVLAGSKITATWANSTLHDIRDALSDSLSRSGKGGMLVPFYFTSGTKSAPGISFSDYKTSGWYATGTSSSPELRLSIANYDTLKVSQSALYFNNYKIPQYAEGVFFFPGKPAAAGQLLARIGVTMPTRLQATLAGTVSYAGLVSSSQAVVKIKKLSGSSRTDVGTVTFSTSTYAGTAASAADVDFAAGDFIEIYAPETLDSTLGDISITLKLWRM